METAEVIAHPLALVIGCVVSVLLVIAFAIAMVQRKRNSRRVSRTRSFFLITAVVITLAFILTLSQGFALMEVPLGLASATRCLFDSIHDTFQVISLDGSMRIFPEDLEPVGWSRAATWTYLIYQSVLFVLAPATTFGSVAYAFYKALSSPALWWLSKTRDTYLFSEVNSSALTLAKSIIDHYKDAKEQPVVAFAEIDRADEAIVDEARELRIVCSDKSIDELAARCSRNKERYFIFSSENEAQNLHASLRLTEVLAAEQTQDGSGVVPNVIVFSSSSVSDGYVDAAVKSVTTFDGEGNASVHVYYRRFDHTQNTINQVLMERPVFLNVSLAKENETQARELLYGSDERRILVVGAGSMGFAFLKGAIWSSQSNSIHTHIDVIESDESREKRLELECPEIASMLTSKLEGASVDNLENELCDEHRESYDVEFHTCDVFSGEFEEFMRDNGHEISYVFVALGDDLASAQAARRIREMLERSRLTHSMPAAAKPPIVAVIDDSLIASSTAGATSSKGQQYEITPVGSQEALFSYDNVFMPELDRMAMNLNAAYYECYYSNKKDAERVKARKDADDSYYSFEYNRVSSKASAIFLKNHLFELCRLLASGEVSLNEKMPKLSCAIDWTKPIYEPEFDPLRKAYAQIAAIPKWRVAFQELEHRRWNAYMRTLGYERCDENVLKTINASAKKPQNCDHLARLHICLVPFDELEAVDEMYKRVTGVDKHYKQADDDIISHLGEIAIDGKIAKEGGDKQQPDQ